VEVAEEEPPAESAEVLDLTAAPEKSVKGARKAAAGPAPQVASGSPAGRPDAGGDTGAGRPRIEPLLAGHSSPPGPTSARNAA
jgi:hypothetical protein